jgi:hypothetical protein
MTTRRMPAGAMRAADVYRIADGMARPGLDTRSWVTYGTVASFGPPPDPSDPNAIVVAPEGVAVDVLVGTEETPVTCRYGHQGGASATLLLPIRPGDLVLVAIPDGDLGLPGEILRVCTNAGAPLPLEEDRMPVFRNDRVSLFSLVPIELRTAGGARVRLEADGSVDVLAKGGARVHLDADGAAEVDGPGHVEVDSDDVRLTAASASQQAVRGTGYRAAESAMNEALIAALPPLATACAASPDPAVNAIGVFLSTVWLVSLQAFEAGAPGYLSNKVRLE